MDTRSEMTETQPLKSQDTSRLKSSEHGSMNITDTTENGVGQALSDSNGNKDHSTKPEPFKWSKLPRRSQYTLLTCCLGMFFSGCEFYFIVPFFPKEAEEKGVSSTFVGLTFSVLHICIFLASPVYGAYISKLGAKFMYLAGTFIGGCATILFSLRAGCYTLLLVTLCGPGAAFIVPSMLCRSVMALGISAFVTAGFAILAAEFPNHIGKAFGIVEVANGFGFMTGPLVGGVLYQYGGFKTPFFVVGCCLFVNGLFLYMVLPAPKSVPASRKGSPLYLVRSGLFDVALFNFFIASTGIAFIDPTLGKRLEMFDIPTSVVGTVFLVAPGVYAFMAPVYGYLSDVKGIPGTIMIFGTTMVGIGYLLMGPCPVLPFLPSDIWMVFISVGLVGMGFCGVAIPTTKCMAMGAIEIGFPDNIETYGLVSGIFYSGLCAGGMCGTILGGVLLDRYGFPFSATIIALLNFATTLFSVLYFAIRRKRRERKKKHQDAKTKCNLTINDLLFEE